MCCFVPKSKSRLATIKNEVEIIVCKLPLILFLYFLQDHLQEVIEKWDSIDDEIWAKVIVLERNRRVAKGQLISKDTFLSILPKMNAKIFTKLTLMYSRLCD